MFSIQLVVANTFCAKRFPFNNILLWLGPVELVGKVILN